MLAGDIANDLGDLHFYNNCPPLSEGRVCVSFQQAFAALSHGWRWKYADDGDNIHIQRGGLGLKSRR